MLVISNANTYSALLAHYNVNRLCNRLNPVFNERMSIIILSISLQCMHLFDEPAPAHSPYIIVVEAHFVCMLNNNCLDTGKAAIFNPFVLSTTHRSSILTHSPLCLMGSSVCTAQMPQNAYIHAINAVLNGQREYRTKSNQMRFCWSPFFVNETRFAGIIRAFKMQVQILGRYENRIQIS